MNDKSMAKLRADAEQLLAKVREERDELKLKLHLARAEARDEWQKLEPRWEHLQSQVRDIASATGDASKDVGAALGLLADELRHGYARIRKSMHF
jgi:F0F1-type ATP synthase membrane subunit b/b'